MIGAVGSDQGQRQRSHLVRGHEVVTACYQAVADGALACNTSGNLARRRPHTRTSTGSFLTQDSRLLGRFGNASCDACVLLADLADKLDGVEELSERRRTQNDREYVRGFTHVDLADSLLQLFDRKNVLGLERPELLGLSSELLIQSPESLHLAR